MRRILAQKWASQPPGESFDANALEPSIGSSAKPEPASLFKKLDTTRAFSSGVTVHVA